jgi:hemerythrin
MGFAIQKWSDSYKLHNESLDAEHKIFFDISAKIELLKNNTPKLIETIKELVKKTKTHFLNEENYMRSINYDFFEEHKITHEFLLKNLGHFITEFKNANTNHSLLKFQKFTDEIIEHILIDDKKIFHFIQNDLELKKNLRHDIDIFQNAYFLDDHKIFENNILSILSSNQKHVELLLVDFKNTLKKQFEIEEIFLDHINYPLLNRHKKSHNLVISSFEYFQKSSKNFIQDVKMRKFLELIDLWVVNHIIFEDQKVAEFLIQTQTKGEK